MKQIGSAITGLPQAAETPSSLTGPQHGETGSGLTTESLKPLSTEEELSKLSRLLTGLLRVWRETPIGQPLKHDLTATQLTASIGLLKRAQVPAHDPVIVLKVIKQMLIAYVPPGRDLHEDAVQAWLYALEGQPLAAIVECARRQIKSTDEWPPKPGQFLARVKSYAEDISRVQKQLEAQL